MPESDCILCNPRPNALIYRNDEGIVILDDPVRAGHVLVGARIHGESLHDLNPDDAAAMMRLANRVAKLIVHLTDARKVYVAAVGDKDKHFHVHLVPKRDSEPNLGPFIFGAQGWASFLPAQPDAKELARVNGALRDELGR